MSVTVKVLDAKQAIESHKVQNGQTLVLEAKNNVNYQLINDQTGYAPQNILTERDGNDLIIRLEEMDKGVSSGKDSSSDPAIIIKDYYAQDGVSNLVVGLHENGGLYAYVPESGQAVDAISALAQEVVKGQALGGTALGAAVWTFNPWWLAGILGVAAIAGIAAAAGGGSKGSAMASADKANINVDVDGTTAIEMPAGAAAMTVSYIPEGATSTLSLIVQKNADGSYSLINSNGEALSATEVQALDASGVHFDAATGNVTFDPNAVADGTEVKAVTREPGKLPAEAVATTPMVDGQADSAAIAQDALGNEVIAPGADNTSYKVTYTDEAGEVVTVDVVKNGDVWESVNPLPEGVILDPTSGVLTVPENAVMDGSTIDVVSNSGDKTPMNQQVTTPTQDSIADKPVITLSDGGQVSAMPGDDNNEMVANYTDEQGNPQSVKVVKQADGTWKAVDEDGNVIAAKDLPRGVDVDESNGAVTLAPNAVQDGSEIIAQGTSEGKNPTTVTEGPAAADSNISDEPIVSVDGTKGVEATPGADNDAMLVEYTDETGKEQSISVKKVTEQVPVLDDEGNPVLDENGQPVTEEKTVWKAVDDNGEPIADEDLPSGVTVDPESGKVTIDPNGLQDPGVDANGNPIESQVTVTGKTDDPAKADSDPIVESIPADKVADNPTVAQDGKGGITATPGADNEEMVVDYNDENGDKQSVKVAKQEDGTWKPVDESGEVIPAEELPEGVTVNDDGTVSVDANSLKDGEEVKVTGKDTDEDKAPTEETVDAPKDTVADKPVVDADGKGGITATPGADNEEMVVDYNDENGDKQSVKVAKQEDGTWKPVDESGEVIPAEELPEGVTVNDDGTVSVDANSLKDGEEVKVTGKDTDEDKAPTEETVDAPKDTVADKPVVDADGKGGITATPGADNEEMVVDYNDENGDKQSVKVAKQEDGTWKPVDESGEVIPAEELPEGVTVNDDGTVSVDANSLKDGEEVKVTGKDTDEDKAPTEETVDAPKDTVADKPVVEADDKGGITATPGADNEEMVVDYNDENGEKQSVKVAKQEDGTWKPVDENGEVIPAEELPEGVTVNDDGTVSVDANSLKDSEEVKVTGKDTDEGKTPTEETVDAPKDTVADKPVVEADGKGGITATPGADNEEMVVDYKDENGDKQSVKVAKQEDGTWKPVDENGEVIPAEELPEGVTVNDDGTVSVDANSLKDGEEVKFTGKDTDEGKTPTEETVDAPKDTVADKPVVEEDGKGGITATPGADNEEMVVEYNDENGDKQSVKVAKQEDGTWKPVDENGEVIPAEELPEGVTVNDDGTVSVDANSLKDGEEVKFTGKDTDEGKTPTEETVDAPKDTVADKPVVEEDGKGGITATPGADNEEMVVEYNDENGDKQSVKVAKQEDGTWKPVDENGEVIPAEELPEGVTVNDDGSVSVDANSLKDGEEVKVTGKDTDEDKAPTEETVDAPKDTISDEPVITTGEDGSVTVKPGTDNDELVVEYVDENLGKQSVKVGKDENGKWVAKEPSELPESITLDPTTGAVTVHASVLEDGTEVKATGTDTDEPVKAPTEATETAPSIPEVLGVTNNDTDGDGKADNTDVAVKLPSDAQVGDKVQIKDKAGDVVGEKELTAADIKAGEVTLSVEPLKDGETYDVIVSDSEGNESLPAKVDGDQTPPSDIAPTVESVTNNFDEDGDPVSTDVKVTLPEGVEPGDKVQIKDEDGNVIAEKELTQDDIDNGEVTLTTDEPLANEEPYNVVVTDPTNNSSPATPIKGDTSEPVAPTIDSQDDTKNDAGEPVSTTVKGKAEAGSIVTIYNDAGEPVASEKADENGNYEITVAPALDGNYTVTATDEKGNESDATDLDKAAPDAPEITGAYNKDGVTHIKGKTEPGATVKVYDDKGNELGQVVADENGNYDVELNTKLADGQNVEVTATDKAGNESDGSPFIGKEVYPPIIEEVTNNDNGTTTISGTAEPNAKVIVDGVEVTADADGKYTVDVPTKEDGQDYEATATVTNDQGKDVTSEPAKETADTEAPTAPTVAGVTNIDNGSVVTGTAEPGSVVKVIDPDTNEVIGSAVAKEDGSFSVTTNKVLEDKKDYNVTATDEQGNDSNPATATGDTVAPEKPVITDVTNKGDNTTTVKGTAEPGSIVKLTDPDTGKVIGSAKADDSGNYEITAPTLKDGKEYNVTATDDHGNTSDPETVTGDTKAPDAPEITEIDNSGDKSVITGTAEPGSTVSLKDPVTGETIATATADKDGNYTIETDKPLEHDKKYNVTATDDHGNESKPDTFIADTEAPKAPTIDDVTHDDNGSTIKGTAEPGSTVAIKDANGDVIASATADKDGNYEITTEKPLEDGTYDVTATDGQGNESDPTETVVDNTAPDAPEVTEANGNTVKGTAEAGSTVVLKDDKGDVIGSAVADEDGNFEITTEEPLKGHYEVTATDKSDNTSEVTPIDKSVPDAPTNVTAEKTTEGNTQVSGNAEPGSLVKLKNEQGDEIGSATADENGSFTIDVEGGIEGNFDVTASNPNNGQESDPAELPIDTKAPSAPALTANDDGSVTLDLPEDANEGDKVTVTMTPQGSSDPVDVEMTKTADGWSSSNEDLIPATAGNSTTIPENKVADQSEVSATASDAAENSSVAEPVEALEPPKGIAKIYDEKGNLVEEIDTKDFAKFDASWQRYHKEEQWYSDWDNDVNKAGGGVINLNESETRENSQSARGTEWKADHPQALDSDGSWGTTVTSVSPYYIDSSASNRIFFKGDKYDAVNLGYDDWGRGSVLSDRVGDLKTYDPNGEFDYKANYYDSKAKSTWEKTGATAEMDGYTYDQWSITSNTGVTTSIWIEQSMPVF